VKTRRVFAGLLVVALVGGCGVATRAQDADSGSTTGSGNPTNAPAGPIPAGLEKFYQQTPSWQRCGSGSQCATITVPLDYTKPTGDTIELRARKVPARDRTGKIGTLFLNPGGPGASGVQFAAAASFILGPALLRKFDVVGWDPRGVGDSTPVRCLDTAEQDKFLATDGSPDNEAEINELNTVSKGFADACEQRSGKLLPHVSTQDAARDIDVLRALVGDVELNYIGYSYGTFLGATYAELFPKNVGRLVLDGAVDPAKTAEENNIAQAKGFDTALDAFAEDCASRNCQLGTTKAEVLAAVDKLLTETDAKPISG
jgi:pimeloyl-ACP methyl ester carboxylesterase